MDIVSQLCSILFLWFMMCCVYGEQVLQKFNGKIGGTNFTYYRLMMEGEVRLQLESLLGDADLYVSDQTTKPDYDNYEMCSVTCGEDILVLPLSFTRPVMVGVYGHISFEVSHYRLTVFGEGSTPSSYNTQQHSTHTSGDNDDFESLLWNVIGFFWKILLEVIL